MSTYFSIAFDPHIILMVIALLISIMILIRVWAYRTQPISTSFMVFIGCICWWSFCVILEHISLALPAKIFWVRMSYFGIVTIPLSWLVFTLFFVEKESWLSRTKLAALSFIPFVTLVIVWTSSFHHLMWRDIWLDTTIYPPDDAVAHGTWFWIFLFYSYSLISTGLILLINYFYHAPKTYRNRIIILILAVLPPWIINIIFAVKNSTIILDPTPIAFSVTGFLLYWGLSQMQFVNIIPLAYDAVFNSLSEAVLVTDLQDRVVEINPVAQQILKVDKNTIRWKKLQTILPPDFTGIQLEPNQSSEPQVAVTGERTNQRHYSIKISPVLIKGRYSGKVILFHDDTHANLLAITDYLTGLYNKRHFEKYLVQEIARCERQNSHFSLLMIDIDNFKQFNDTYGHLAGDNLLREVGRIINSSIRLMDTAFRYGGEEFAIVLPGSSNDEALKVAERIKSTIEGYRLPGKNNVTASIGISHWPEDGKDPQTLIARADAALYLAKQLGRNKICTAKQVSNNSENTFLEKSTKEAGYPK